MAKSLILSVLALVGSGVFAAPYSRWVEVGSYYETAINETEFIDLQRRYPDYFGNYKSSAVASANIDIRYLEFRGTTFCPPDDPRLKAELTSYGVCGIDGACFQSATGVPSQNDPCAYK